MKCASCGTALPHPPPPICPFCGTEAPKAVPKSWGIVSMQPKAKIKFSGGRPLLIGIGALAAIVIVATIVGAMNRHTKAPAVETDLPAGALVAKYHVPLPPGAEPHAIPAADSYIVPSMTFEQLRGYYHQNMHPGSPWQGHSWCEEHQLVSARDTVDDLWWKGDHGVPVWSVSIVRETPTTGAVTVAENTDDTPCSGAVVP